MKWTEVTKQTPPRWALVWIRAGDIYFGYYREDCFMAITEATFYEDEMIPLRDVTHWMYAEIPKEE